MPPSTYEELVRLLKSTIDKGWDNTPYFSRPKDFQFRSLGFGLDDSRRSLSPAPTNPAYYQHQILGNLASLLEMQSYLDPNSKEYYPNAGPKNRYVALTPDVYERIIDHSLPELNKIGHSEGHVSYLKQNMPELYAKQQAIMQEGQKLQEHFNNIKSGQPSTYTPNINPSSWLSSFESSPSPAGSVGAPDAPALQPPSTLQHPLNIRDIPEIPTSNTGSLVPAIYRAPGVPSAPGAPSSPESPGALQATGGGMLSKIEEALKSQYGRTTGGEYSPLKAIPKTSYEFQMDPNALTNAYPMLRALEQGDYKGAAMHGGALGVLTALMNSKYAPFVEKITPKALGRIAGYFPAHDMAVDFMEATSGDHSENIARGIGAAGLGASLLNPLSAAYMSAGALGTGAGRAIYDHIGPGYEASMANLGEAYQTGGLSGLINQLPKELPNDTTSRSMTGGIPGYLH